ncbi:MAG: PQQ-dependent sugar dehydrogenase [Candidatus Methylomirabilia bacterium]
MLLLGAKMAAAAALAPAIQLELVVGRGLSNPVYVTHAGDGSGRLFVLEQPGRIRIMAAGALLRKPLLDITDRVQAGGERGLLGLAFHPKFRENGRYFVNYTRRPDGATVVSEFRVSADPNVSKRTERILLTIAQPYSNHNGGMIEFGPDGYLYIGTGDGGLAGDPGNRAQNRNDLLGKILRIDVDRGNPYAATADNPFVAAGGGRPEIYAWGLRNPWRFSFDRATKELYVADVGQNRWEEINIVRRGGNYGWRIMEGAHCFLPRTGCDTTSLVLPVAEYSRRLGRCSITGGYVYRGRQIPALVGTYIYGDFCSGEIFGLRDRTQTILLSTDLPISSFGEDQAGEVYVVDHGGTIHRIVGADPGVRAR